MKHVFVETNFLIELLRPFPSREAGQHAAQLLERAKANDLVLYLPWCAKVEATRTLFAKIEEDLGFAENMMKFAVKTFTAGAARFDKREVDKLHEQAREARKDASSTIKKRIEEVAARTTVIEPTKEVINRTLKIFETRSLKPFDEMILGAVIQTATELYARSERDLWFCNLNTKDFAADRPGLDTEYKACGLQYLASFDVP